MSMPLNMSFDCSDYYSPAKKRSQHLLTVLQGNQYWNAVL